MNRKDRNPWIAGILTFLTLGLGHLYSGKAQKGFCLFLVGQGIQWGVLVPVLYYCPTPLLMALGVFAVLAYSLYCLFDAVKLARSKRYGFTLKKYNRWYVYLGCWILGSLVLQSVVGESVKTFWVQAYKIPAGSLKPTLLVGDHILARKQLAVKQGIDRGDIVIFPYPRDRSKDYIKRVVAMGGEIIEIVDKQVFVNGDPLPEPYAVFMDPKILPKGSMGRDNFGPATVPMDALFVMGDNRDHSNDSRYWGFLEKDSVKGKAHTIYWSWDKDAYKVRWGRIGKIVE